MSGDRSDYVVAIGKRCSDGTNRRTLKDRMGQMTIVLYKPRVSEKGVYGRHLVHTAVLKRLLMRFRSIKLLAVIWWIGVVPGPGLFTYVLGRPVWLCSF